MAPQHHSYHSETSGQEKIYKATPHYNFEFIFSYVINERDCAKIDLQGINSNIMSFFKQCEVI